jgi:ferrous iron transport protein B
LPHYRIPQLKRVGLRLYDSGKDFIIRAGTVIFAMTIIIWALLYFPRPVEVAESVTSEYASANIIINEAKLEDRINAAYLEQSYMGRFGQFVQPIFEPAGYDWKITVGVLASFPAREIIISTLGITYALGGEIDEDSDDLRSTLSNARWEDGPRMGQAVFNLPVALSIMVFFALCMQCGATIAVIAKELNWYWATGSFFGLTGIAWVAAVLTYQIGMWLA